MFLKEFVKHYVKNKDMEGDRKVKRIMIAQRRSSISSQTWPDAVAVYIDVVFNPSHTKF